MICPIAQYRTLFRVFCDKFHPESNKTINARVTIVNIDARHFVKCKAEKEMDPLSAAHLHRTAPGMMSSVPAATQSRLNAAPVVTSQRDSAWLRVLSMAGQTLVS